jgi:hypothetical protein
MLPVDLSFSSISSADALFDSANASNQHNNTADLDDFDDFVSSPLRTPSPPRLPAKTSAKPRSVLAPLKSPIAPKPEKKAHGKADHSRTLSLLENAASRPGRWPAPPSPQPEAIPGPGAAQANPSEIDLLAGGSTMQQQQANAMKTSVSLPAIFNHVSTPSNGSSNSFNNATPLPPPLNTLPRNPTPSLMKPASRPLVPTNNFTSPAPAASSTGGGVGKLSAQDLSFFEGL